MRTIHDSVKYQVLRTNWLVEPKRTGSSLLLPVDSDLNLLWHVLVALVSTSYKCRGQSTLRARGGFPLTAECR
jgi:hypothetical protein